MRLHQAPISGLAERIEDDQLLGGTDRSRRVARQPVDLCQAVERADQCLAKPGALVLDPPTVLSRQEGAPGEGLGRRGIGACLVELAHREGALGRGRCLVGGDDVDPGSGREAELVAAEGAGQKRGAIGPHSVSSARSLLDGTESAFSQVAGGSVPPERLGKLVPGDGTSWAARRYAKTSLP